MQNNPMRRIRVEKITLNMGVGEPGSKLDKAKSILQTISGSKVVITKTRKRTVLGGAKGRPIGVKTTLRGVKASSLLERLLKSGDFKLKASQFDNQGNFNFGIPEYINIPGVKYDPDVGILGLDVSVTLERKGYRVKRRKIKTGRIGADHMINREEGIEFAKKFLNIKVIEE